MLGLRAVVLHWSWLESANPGVEKGKAHAGGSQADWDKLPCRGLLFLLNSWVSAMKKVREDHFLEATGCSQVPVGVVGSDTE